jgi:glycosyltransferase involved in cell wall biosynthesis
MKLSIIIPYYNTKEYTEELLLCLEPQITEDVEVLLVDDGSTKPFTTKHKFVKVIRKKNGGPASARNVGIEKSTGDYLVFIDSDDLVAPHYVSSILKKIESEPDIVELSWKTMPGAGAQGACKLNSVNDWLWNPSACHRVFKRSFIGDVRFNELKDSTEDEDFSRRFGFMFHDTPMKRDVITDYMYYYRTSVEGSNSKRYVNGLKNTKRIVYYYNHVTSDMTNLIDEFRKEDETNEVILLTNRNDLPELRRYCQIKAPRKIWGHYKRGEPCDYIMVKTPPVRTQVVLYRKDVGKVGGIQTFMVNFCKALGDKYDITIVADKIDPERMMQFVEQTRVVASKDVTIHTNILIMMSVLDPIPKNVVYDKLVRMCHACKSQYIPQLPTACDEMVFVSEAARKTFGDPKGVVIHNPYIVKEDKQPLVLVSATRIPAPDKGDYISRMRKLAQMLNSAQIPFVWFNFSNGQMPDAPKNFYNMPATMHIEWFINMATYVVQLSDYESWSYTMIEALCNGKPVLCTEFDSIREIGIEDGVHGYMLPFDMNFDVKKILDVPKVSFAFDNKPIIKSWKKILGSPEPFSKYVPEEGVLVEVVYPYTDVYLNMQLKVGTRLYMKPDRAKYLQDDHPYHVVKIIGG